MKKKILLFLIFVGLLGLTSCLTSKVVYKFNLTNDETLVGNAGSIALNDPIVNGLTDVYCEKDGYEFIGWSLDGKNPITDEIATEYVIYLKPIFDKLPTYQVTFKIKGLDDIVANYYVGEKIVVPNVESTNELKFIGWDKEVPNEMPEKNLVFNAIFEEMEKEYKVIFKIDGRDDIVLKYKEGETIVVPTVESNEDFKFIGWDKQVPSVMPSNDLVFNALFEEIIHEYKITFKIDGRDDIVLKYKEGETIVVPTVESTKKVTFLGWDKEVPTVMGKEDLVFNAKFQVNYYTISYSYDEGKWPLYTKTLKTELIDELFTDFYNYLESSEDFNLFIKGSDGLYKSGLWYNYKDKLYMAEVKDVKEDASCFINDVRYHDKWIGFFNELDKCVSEINASQSLWGSTYVGIMRIYEVGDSSTRYTDEQITRILNSVKFEENPITSYKPGEEVELLELSSDNGRDFLGWYYDNEKITKVTSDFRCDLELVAKWSDPVFPSSLVINNIPTSLEKGLVYELQYVMTPNNITHPDLIWSSSNTGVASISKGIIETYGYGKTTISVYSKYANDVKVEFELVVFPDLSSDTPVIYMPYDTKEILVFNVFDEVDLYQGVKAQDLTDGDLTSSIVVDDSNVDYENAGIYKVKYLVLDSSGNKTTLERTIKIVEPSELIFIGHAGSYLGIMNTEEAFINGIKVKGYKALECDVKQTKDGVFVTCHDNDFNGVDIASTNYADLKDVVKTLTRGGISYSSTICTFERYLEICKENNVYAVVELKSSAGITNSDQSRMPALMKVISDKGMLDKVIFLGSQYNCLIWVKNNGYDYIPCQYLVNSCESETIFERCVTNDLDISFNISYSNSEEWIERYHDMGLKVSCYTFNQYTAASTLQEWIDKGVDFVTCDVLTEKDIKMPTYDTDDSPEYSVIFKLEDGTILKESVIKEGKKAYAPTAPNLNGYKFVGWDTDFSKVTSNLVVIAKYELEEYNIKFNENLVESKQISWSSKEEFVSEFYTDWFNWIVANAGKRDGITFDGTSYTIKMNTSTYGTATFKDVSEMRELGVYYVEQTIGTLVYKPITSTNSATYEMEVDNNYFLNTEPYRTKYQALNAYFLNVIETAYSSYNKNYKPTSAGKVQIFFRFHQWQKGTKIPSFDSLPVKYETKEIEVTNLIMPIEKFYTINDEVSLESPSCDEYTFVGWYKDKECTTKVEKIEKGTYGEILLYAKWVKNE